MKLYWSSRSPFVRKVMICAHELGLADRLALERVAVKPEAPSAGMMAMNPLNKIPTLVLEDGTVIYDSAVICEYLDMLAGGDLFPAPGPARWVALRRQTLADGMMDLGLARSGEKRRAVPSPEFTAAFEVKVRSALDAFEAEAGALSAGAPTIGEIACVCALAQLDFRFGGDRWRDGCPGLAAWFDAISRRPSIVATAFEDIR